MEWEGGREKTQDRKTGIEALRMRVSLALRSRTGLAARDCQQAEV